MSEGPASRRQFSTSRLLAMVALFAVGFGLLVNFGVGSAPVFFLGTVGSAVAFGAAIGVLLDRTAPCSLLGAAAGLAFFLYAVVN